MGSPTSPNVDAFINDGFVCLRGAFPREVADECRALLWQEIGASPVDPSTWTQPVVRVFDRTQSPFIEAANTPVLHQQWRSNVWSDGRALLMLFLFSDVGERDAPTRIRIGSHLRMPSILEPYGRAGTTSFLDYSCTDDLPQVLATGEAGDVYLCHPFLVHSAQPNIDGTPRFMGQPPLHLVEGIGFELDGPSPVEQAIRLGLRDRT